MINIYDFMLFVNWLFYTLAFFTFIAYEEMNINNLPELDKNDFSALKEFEKKLFQRFHDVKIILYGSKARGDCTGFSDIDVLIILNCNVDNRLREKIFSMSFEIELEYDVIFGLLVESKHFWDSSRAKSMPIHWNIDNEGILLTEILNEE